MDFYYNSASPPCCAVIMLAKALGIELNKIFLNIPAGEQLKPEYVKINPTHTIPTINDNGFILWESRAIMIYLVEKYGKEDDTLYPKCPRKQAVINQRLQFDLGTLNPSFVNYYHPQIKQKLPADPEMFKKIESALELLNTFLEGNQYAAGDQLTIADLTLLSSISSYDATVNFDFSKYPNITRWYDNCKKTAPGWEENWKGCLELKSFINYKPDV